jgi:predicted AAA+ superfamily ATPase
LLLLSSLVFYRNILNNDVIKKYVLLLESVNSSGCSKRSAGQFINAYCKLLNAISSQSNSFDLQMFLAKTFLYDENYFSKSDFKNESNSAILEKDISALQFICSITAQEIKQAALYDFSEDEEAQDIIKALPEWVQTVNTHEPQSFLLVQNTKLAGLTLREFYKANGYGIFAMYGAFVYKSTDHGSALEPVLNTDEIQISDLKSYEYERTLVFNNTQDFLNGYCANNMLLYGDRGTGKSSTIKAVFNALKNKGLRIVEISKNNLTYFNELTKLISQSTLKFILFIDDLNFSDDDENYSALKAALEGGMAARPKNAVIYATSNRRHLVKEHFSEREDVNAGDNIQEKLSLADRFGITVTFSSPDQKLYLKIVNELAADSGIEMPKEKLERGAIQWALTYNGRSPRAAKQFINWLEADKKRQSENGDIY